MPVDARWAHACGNIGRCSTPRNVDRTETARESRAGSRKAKVVCMRNHRHAARHVPGARLHRRNSCQQNRVQTWHTRRAGSSNSDLRISRGKSVQVAASEHVRINLHIQ